MKKTFKKLLALSFLLTVSVPALAESPKAAAPSNALRITVRILNIAEVPPETLAQAGEVITGIFSQAGIEATWLDCSTGDEDPQSACNQALAPTHFLVRLITDAKALGIERHPSCCGLALRSEDGESSNHAYIFYDCLGKVASKARIARGRILGYVLSHEIGHLLLPAGAHTRWGIMRANLNGKDWQRTPTLIFLPEQSDQLHSRLLARMEKEGATRPAPES
jgi:hypothetical protein